MLNLTSDFLLFLPLLACTVFGTASTNPVFASSEKAWVTETKNVTNAPIQTHGGTDSHAISRRAVDENGSDPNENPYLTGDVQEPSGTVDNTDTAGLDDLKRPPIQSRTGIPPKKWPGNVFTYYLNTTGFSVTELNFIKDAIVALEINTKCLYFRRVDPKTIKGAFHYAHIFKDGDNTCQANGLGFLRQDGAVGVTMQTIKLGKNCFPNSYGKAAHEMMHALGFPHEQVRPDRDNYVTVVPESSFKTKNDFYQFEKRKYTEYIMSTKFFKENPYDFYSIMHYSLDDPTHFFLKASVQNTMTMRLTAMFTSKVKRTIVGQRSSLTCGDIKKLDFVYGDCKSKPKSELGTSASSRLKVSCTNTKTG